MRAATGVAPAISHNGLVVWIFPESASVINAYHRSNYLGRTGRTRRGLVEGEGRKGEGSINRFALVDLI